MNKPTAVINKCLLSALIFWTLVHTEPPAVAFEQQPNAAAVIADKIDWRALATSEAGVREKIDEYRALSKRGDNAKAAGSLRSAIAEADSRLGEGSLCAGFLSKLLALHLQAKGLSDHSEIESLLLKSLVILERHFGPKHTETTDVLRPLSDLYFSNQDFATCSRFREKALEISKELNGRYSIEAVEDLEFLASVRQQQLLPVQSLALFKDSLETLDVVAPDDYARRIPIMMSMASILESNGDRHGAVRLMEEGWNMAMAKLGPTNSIFGPLSTRIAESFQRAGHHEEACRILTQALEHTTRQFGTNSDSAAQLHRSLALSLLPTRKHEEALAHAEAGLRIVEGITGYNPIALLGQLDAMAQVLIAANRDADASRVIRQIELNPNSLMAARSLLNLANREIERGRFKIALELTSHGLILASSSFGGEHPAVEQAVRQIAFTQLLGGFPGAEDSIAELNRLVRLRLPQELLHLSENDAMAYMAQDQSLTDSLHSLSVPRMPENPQNTHIVAVSACELALRKGFLLTINAIRAEFDSRRQTGTHELQSKLQNLRLKLHQTDRATLSPNQSTARQRELQKELSELETKLAERVGLLALTVRERNLSLVDIAFSLPPQAVLLDFVHYRQYDLVAKKNQGKEHRYAAYLTFPAPLPEAPVLDPNGKPVLPIPAYNPALIVQRVDLGEAAPINAAVAELHQLFAERRIAPQRLEPVLQRLGALLYAPLARHLTNVAHLIVCSDGQLGRLPFELLPVDAKGRRLVEDKLITYVSSGREVARLAQPRAAVATSAPLVMGNPDFDFILPGSSPREEAPIKPGTQNAELGTNSLSLLTSAATPRQRFLSRSFRDFKFTPLPDSENEARKAAAMLGTNCVLRLGVAAREADLKAVSSPRVLHLATHGFFLTDQEFKRTNGLAENFLLAGSFPAGGSFPSRQSFAPPGQDWENPLIRCGIALAGANRATGITNAVAEDGILTGLEAALLNLQGTELVILSACDSGSGDVKIGEGVMSLRRAFTIAGAETVLASHWKVNDAATSALMTEFMRRWRAGTPRGQAWREAQLSLLRSKDFSNPYFWAAFTLTGQWR